MSLYSDQKTRCSGIIFFSIIFIIYINKIFFKLYDNYCLSYVQLFKANILVYTCIFDNKSYSVGLSVITE